MKIHGAFHKKQRVHVSFSFVGRFYSSPPSSSSSLFSSMQTQVNRKPVSIVSIHFYWKHGEFSSHRWMCYIKCECNSAHESIDSKTITEWMMSVRYIAFVRSFGSMATGVRYSHSRFDLKHHFQLLACRLNAEAALSFKYGFLSLRI